MGNMVALLSSEQVQNLLVNSVLAIFLIILIVAFFFKNRYRIYAILIPFATTLGVLIYHLQSKYIIWDKEQKAIEVLANINKAESNLSTPIKDEMINAIRELMNNDLKTSLDLMISLFAVAISVWVGLTIYNAIKKDEFDKLSDMVNEAKEISEQNMELYKTYLLKNLDVNNNSSQYFYNLFTAIDAQKFDYYFLMNATFLETIYVKVSQLHKLHEHVKMDSFLSEGLKLCDRIIEGIENNKTFSNYMKNKLYGYANYRYARMYFYKAFVLYYTVDKYDENVNFLFDKSVEFFEKAIKCDPQISEEVNIYNTIGYIYIKSYDYIRDYKDYTCWDTDDKMKDLLKKAYTNCEKSYNKNMKTSLSVKNLGIVLERQHKMDEAIKKYYEAIAKDPTEYTSHICLASSYLKETQKLMNIDIVRTKPLFELTYTSSEKIYEYIHKAYKELSICYALDASNTAFYYKMGQLYTYRLLLEKNIENRVKLIERAKYNFDIVLKLNPIPKAYQFHLRNFYEAIGNIKKANEINSQLEHSDSEHYKELYSNYM